MLCSGRAWQTGNSEAQSPAQALLCRPGQAAASKWENNKRKQNSHQQAQQWRACRRALGVVRSSTYTQPSAAKSSAASRAILCMRSCVVVQAWMASNSLKHSGRERAPGARERAVPVGWCWTGSAQAGSLGKHPGSA